MFHSPADYGILQGLWYHASGSEQLRRAYGARNRYVEGAAAGSAAQKAVTGFTTPTRRLASPSPGSAVAQRVVQWVGPHRRLLPDGTGMSPCAASPHQPIPPRTRAGRMSPYPSSVAIRIQWRIADVNACLPVRGWVDTAYPHMTAHAWHYQELDCRAGHRHSSSPVLALSWQGLPCSAPPPLSPPAQRASRQDRQIRSLGDHPCHRGRRPGQQFMPRCRGTGQEPVRDLGSPPDRRHRAADEGCPVGRRSAANRHQRAE